MSKKRLISIISVILNLCILLFTVFSVHYYYSNSSSFSDLITQNIFKFFTNLSNIFVAATGFIMMIASLRNAIKNQLSVPKWIMILKFTATVSVAVTMITVFVFFAPRSVQNGRNFFSQFRENYFFLHFLTPLISLISVIFFERAENFKFRYCLPGVLPVMIYSALYYYNVIVIGYNNGGWPNIYGFKFSENDTITFLAGGIMYLGCFAISALIWKLQNTVSKKITE